MAKYIVTLHKEVEVEVDCEELALEEFIWKELDADFSPNLSIVKIIENEEV